MAKKVKPAYSEGNFDTYIVVFTCEKRLKVMQVTQSITVNRTNDTLDNCIEEEQNFMLRRFDAVEFSHVLS